MFEGGNLLVSAVTTAYSTEIAPMPRQPVRLLTLIAFAAVMFLPGPAFAAADSLLMDVPKNPVPAYDFNASLVTGKKVKLSDFKGKVVFLNFWATWCPPCREEIPMFLKYYEKYRSQGLVFIGVAIDNKEDVEAYIDTMFIDYPILMGNEETLELMRRYGNRVGSLPYNVLIGRDGTILNTKKGAYTHSQLEALLKPLFEKNSK